MTPFELFEKLPRWLEVVYRNRIYTMSPALLDVGGQIWLCYQGHGKRLVLHERINNQQELEEAVNTWAERLERTGRFHASKLFTA